MDFIYIYVLTIVEDLSEMSSYLEGKFKKCA